MNTINRKLSEQFVDFIDLSDEDLEEIPIQGTGANLSRQGTGANLSRQRSWGGGFGSCFDFDFGSCFGFGRGFGFGSCFDGF